MAEKAGYVAIADPDNQWQSDLPGPTLSPQTNRGGTAVVFVSLYLLLLAFFIFLHSVSVPQEERARSVLGSISLAFKGLSKETPAEKQKTLSGEEQGTQEFHAKLRNVFETAVPLVESRVTRDGTRLQFSVPVDQLFNRGSDGLRDLKQEFLDDVAGALIRRNQNTATDLEILIGAGLRLPTDGDIENNLATARVNNLVQQLLSLGVPSRNLSIGMEEGDAGLVHFSFFLRSSLNFQFQPDGDRQ
ncbi:MAG: hypothetical protein COB93_03545 [Sneathiella sp.]|nr:MAG: hypothetical protein COB93_03545 [Sneathiella sp.]